MYFQSEDKQFNKLLCARQKDVNVCARQEK